MATAPAPAPGQLIVAGIGALVTSRDPQVTLIAYGLGSCVGLAAWDPRLRAGGLAHFMLPSGPDDQVGPTTPVKFIAGGLERFLAELKAMGIPPSRATLKAAGGASMLQVLGGGLEIGKRNSDAIVAALAAAGLKLAKSDLGGRAGRTVQLEVATGRLLIKSVSNVYEL
jgi:chemotaxis protein CheD